jgi:pyroglutamyl-peptidase
MLPSNQSLVQQFLGSFRLFFLMTILLTGFPQYADVGRNPSEQIVAALDGSTVEGHAVVGRVLPVSAARTPSAVRAAIEETAPDLALLLGVAPGRAGLSIERTAVNVLDFPDPDNDGAQPVDVPIEPDGPVAYFTTLPARRIVEAWRAAGIPGYLSDTAGTYLCNAAMYVVLHATAEGRCPAGFVHLPSLPDEVAGQRTLQPSMPLATQIDGVRIALAAMVESLAA